METLIHECNIAPNGSTALYTGFHGRLAAAACGSRLDALTLTNLHGGLVVDSGRSHALLDLSGHRQECLLDVGCVLGGGLEEGNSKAVGKLLWKRQGNGNRQS